MPSGTLLFLCSINDAVPWVGRHSLASPTFFSRGSTSPDALGNRKVRHSADLCSSLHTFLYADSHALFKPICIPIKLLLSISLIVCLNTASWLLLLVDFTDRLPQHTKKGCLPRSKANCLQAKPMLSGNVQYSRWWECSFENLVSLVYTFVDCVQLHPGN